MKLEANHFDNDGSIFSKAHGLFSVILWNMVEASKINDPLDLQWFHRTFNNKNIPASAMIQYIYIYIYIYIYREREREGILPKGPYPPCLRMADRALLAGYPRYMHGIEYI